MLSTIAPLLETSYRLVSRAEGNLVWPFADARGPVQADLTPLARQEPLAPLGESPEKLTIDDAQLRAHQALRSAGLTARQAEIALLVASGAATSQIATALQISTGTVRKHLEAVHATLGVSSRAAVAATVMRLVHPEAAGILGQPLLSR
ncbi:LuxR C-terminal-related transcriptional regulator [Microbacterium sp. NPDC076895]|uniref:response regulator transcription factor n=1 Tax=Microbacterium sp. NPDC076895 TaxID=3154957 RepID=UPI003423A564